MSRREIIISEFVEELKKTTPDDYQQIKLILLAVTKNSILLGFLNQVFEAIEAGRPLLIEMKEGVVNG